MGTPLASAVKKTSFTPKATIHQKFGVKACYKVEEIREPTENGLPGLTIVQKGPCLFRCHLELSEFSVVSAIFKKKKDAEQSASELALEKDMIAICTNGGRIAKCMKEFFFFRKNYKAALNVDVLAKSLHQKLWDDSPYLLKQLSGIGMVTAKALLSMGVTSFEAFSEADPRKIEMVTGRKYPFGNHIKESLLSLPPKTEIKLEETDFQRQGKSKIQVTLTRLSEGLPQSTKRHYADMVVGLEEENLILFHEKIRVEDFLRIYHNTLCPLTMLLSGVRNDELIDEMPYIDEPKTNFLKFIRLRKDELLSSASTSNMKDPILFDHRPLKLNNDDYLRVCEIPKHKGANYRDIKGVKVGKDNIAYFDPDVKRSLLP